MPNMKAVRIHAYGGPEVLRYEDAPRPDVQPGSVLVNSRTSRIRKLVMESGPRNLSQWLEYERDIRADFTKAFGEAPGALVSIGIMTDTDNTQSTAQAWYGPVRLVPVASGPKAKQ